MPCAKRMVGCRRDCLHRTDIRAYQVAREAAEVKREDETKGYATELAAYPPIITLKDWLIAKGGSAEEEEQWESAG